MVLALFAAEVYAVARVSGALPWLAWIVLGPFALRIGSILLLFGLALCGKFLSTLKPTNWLAYLDPDGLWLNRRSCRNTSRAATSPSCCCATTSSGACAW